MEKNSESADAERGYDSQKSYLLSFVEAPEAQEEKETTHWYL